MTEVSNLRCQHCGGTLSITEPGIARCLRALCPLATHRVIVPAQATERTPTADCAVDPGARAHVDPNTRDDKSSNFNELAPTPTAERTEHPSWCVCETCKRKPIGGTR